MHIIRILKLCKSPNYTQKGFISDPIYKVRKIPHTRALTLLFPKFFYKEIAKIKENIYVLFYLLKIFISLS